MKALSWPLLVLFCCASACADSSAQPAENAAEPQTSTAAVRESADQGTDEGEDEREIALAEVPDLVKKAALAAVSGLELREAEVEVEEGRTVYELEGVAAGVEYEIEVDATGKVLEVEKETAGD